jgi:sulfopyruvate decarboxylase TPP-binding subunit
MITGPAVAALLKDMEISHVVTVPDGTIGRWEGDIEKTGIQMVRVCREGEAWTIAGGLYLGGATPLVMIQCTGLFESGDAIRNMVHEWKLPLYAIIGFRSYLNQENLPGDTSLVFTEPILAAWKLDVNFITSGAELEGMPAHYRACQSASKPGIALIAEGRS